MLATDVNVLIYAHRRGIPRHEEYRVFLDELVSADAPYGVSELVLSSFLRLVTNPSIFTPADSMEAALAFTDFLREQPNAVLLAPGPRHWEIFSHLCRTTGVKGNLVTDAYLAALAIETDSEWITTDRDFARFPGLKWRHPLQAPSR